MIGYVREYKHLKPEQTLEVLQRDIQWRQSLPYDINCILAQPPDGRAEFESMYQVGPIGRDGDGHAVVLERVGRIPAQAFVRRFDETANLAHSVYNREAAIAMGRALSHVAGQRIVAITPIIDLQGMGMSHLRLDFLRLVKQTITTCLAVP